jgi:hypothetical protein
MDTAKAITTGRKEESLSRSSGVGSLLERIGSLMVSWMQNRVLGFAYSRMVHGGWFYVSSQVTAKNLKRGWALAEWAPRWRV